MHDRARKGRDLAWCPEATSTIVSALTPPSTFQVKAATRPSPLSATASSSASGRPTTRAPASRRARSDVASVQA